MMGCCCSTANVDVSTGEHSALPEDAIPYKGLSLQYCFLDMRVIGTTFMGRYLKADFAPHYAGFQEPYNQGFRVVLLKKVPGVLKKLHVQYGMERRYYLPFMAAFVRSTNAPPVPVGMSKIVQTSIEFSESVSPSSVAKVTAAQEVANMTEFDATIEENGCQGFQFVSFEAGSYSKKKGTVREMVLGMELVFHKFTDSLPTSYIYQSIIIPVSYTVVRQMAASRRRTYGLATDVTPHIVDMLQQGWKIVDTNYLSSHLQGVFMPTDNAITFNTLWIFEKPAGAADDLRPRWECSIVKYKHIVRIICNGTAATTTWNPILVEMGQRGWELACILDTAESSPAGWRVEQTLLLVFQRPLL